MAEQQQQTNNKPRTGVADYFGIIGVGDQLVWKHLQKQNDAMSPEQGADATVKETEPDEEERFLREIVDVAVLALEDEPHQDEASNNLSMLSSSCPSDVDAASSSHVASNETTTDISDQHPHLAAVITTSSSQQQQTIPAPPQSPSCSDSTSITTPQQHISSRRNKEQRQRDEPLQQLQHWTAIQKTLPAATAGYVPIHSATERSDDEPDEDSSCLADEVHHASVAPRGPQLWSREQVWDANLSWNFGLRAVVHANRAKVVKAVTQNHTPLKKVHTKWQSKIQQAVGRWKAGSKSKDEEEDDPWFAQQAHQKFVLAYRRRKQSDAGGAGAEADANDFKQSSQCEEAPFSTQRNCTEVDERPAVADLRLFYVRLHRNLLVPPKQQDATCNDDCGNILPQDKRTDETASSHGTETKRSLTSLLLEGAFQSQAKQLTSPEPNTSTANKAKNDTLVPVEEYLDLPEGFEEWSIPGDYQWIRDPRLAAQEETVKKQRMLHQQQPQRSSPHSSPQSPSGKHGFRTKVLFPNHNEETKGNSLSIKEEEEEEGGQSADTNGIEVAAMSLSPSESNVSASTGNFASESAATQPPPASPLESFLPGLVTQPPHDIEEEALNNICYIPVVAYRRQRTGDDERYHEDPSIVEMAVSFLDTNGRPVLPHFMVGTNGDDFEDEEDEHDFCVLGKTAWAMAGRRPLSKKPTARRLRRQFGAPAILVRKNHPFGFADAAFATSVLDRFPQQNYKGLPLPQEELPMFCYPSGCRLFRARYSDAPLAQYYGFVVKNERGDSIYVSCVSFMEPLTALKVEQLAQMSEKRKRTSLPHKKFCEKRERQRLRAHNATHGKKALDTGSDCSTEADSNFILTGFDDMTTFENKTICLVSRYPFWTAFRKFLSHLHILSGSVSDLPLERRISHLLLSVPLPKPGGHNVIVPLPALNEPMILSLPPGKDFPILDLPYQRLLACLEINTVVMLVLGMLALEKKVIVMSTRPSLVLDVCELLRSLLFPFDLCAPYVPRLTEPFKSSLDFPGAIFVGIHDDGSPNGLAATVRKELPEDSIVVDLETGEIESDIDRLEVIKNAWDILPRTPRSELVKELQTLCSDAGIDDGQEPLDSQYDSAFEVSLPDALDDDNPTDIEVQHIQPKEPLDGRAIRDAFLRFFCKVLAGYERFLVVPDADFLVSGNEWFDAQGFLASVRSDRTQYLSALVSTQLFQSFIQRRTEASDVHCLLFDECMEEYHASPKPYGRLGDDMEMIQDDEDEKPRVIYSLLVDQAAAFPVGFEQQSFVSNKSFDVSETDSGTVNALKATLSFAESYSKYAESAFNPSGDLVTGPSKENLPHGQRYVYCLDGNACFPHKFNQTLFLPKEPESWLVEISTTPNPLLARSERELEEADRRRRHATSHHGFQRQRRCLWQLPKLMGSHFLGAWLLCVPGQVSQPGLSHEQQSRYLLRALGALRVLRSKQRIVPDEAAYRALMVACGRSSSDRRGELVRLFGFLRSDGIFPSAVTLGQYTKGLAEGYSKQMGGETNQEEDMMKGMEGSETASRAGRIFNLNGAQRGAELEAALMSMDGHLDSLEQQGRRWRNRHGLDRKEIENEEAKEQDEKKKRTNRSWLPVVYSSSFVPTSEPKTRTTPKVQLVAMWSRTRSCRNCTYIPLEEEVQAGWDVVGGDDESSGAISCPRCGSLFVPMLGIREFSVEEALKGDMDNSHSTDPLLCRTADFHRLPPQISPRLSSTDTVPGETGPAKIHFVAYKSPVSVRISLEQYVEEYGEEVLVREKLRELDPELFFNFWWYCARFSLPLPLSVSGSQDGENPAHAIAFAGWDQAIAERACFSASLVLSLLFEETPENVDKKHHNMAEQIDPFDDHPLLSRFNLPGFYSSVWDHEELSKILVSLVEACDKRDFKPVLECVLQKNEQRRETYTPSGSRVEEGLSVEFEVYRTILYLAKYQCTTAFHAFFPATVKPCKGYHYWCAQSNPLPIFDRLLRDAVKKLSNDRRQVASDFVGDVALGFRCTFGHLI